MLEKLDAFPGAGRRRLPELLVHLVELVPLVVSDAFRGPVDKLPGEQRLGGEQVADVRRRQGGNDEPAARLELDEPLALQREQALANRRGTEVEFLGDALLPDELTRAQAAAHDQFADMARHLVTELLSRGVAAACVAVDHLFRFLPDGPGDVSIPACVARSSKYEARRCRRPRLGTISGLPGRGRPARSPPGPRSSPGR